MDCPVCHKPMIILELHQVEIDYCQVCEGIWLDEGEIELLLEGAEEKDALLSSFMSNPDCKEKQRKCPICLKHMDKVLVDNNRMLVDRCAINHGIWFDKGELSQLLGSGFGEKGGKVLDLLKDMFYETRNQEG